MYHTVFVIAIPESDRIPLGYDQKVSSLTDTLGHSFKVNFNIISKKDNWFSSYLPYVEIFALL